MAAAGNLPGGRHDPVSWKDANGWADAGGNLWLFGGKGYDSAGTLGDLNDLWKYPSQRPIALDGPVL